jgi:hypothetical protein
MLFFSIIGICIKLFFGNTQSEDGSYGRANSTIWGYGVVLIAVTTVLFVNYALYSKIGQNTGVGRFDSNGELSLTGIFNFIKSFLSSSAPAMIMIGMMVWVMSLNITYFTRINKGQVANEYFQLTLINSFLCIFQLIALFMYLKTYTSIELKTEEILQAQSRLSFATYFISTINLIVVGMMTIILEFFSTDG